MKLYFIRRRDKTELRKWRGRGIVKVNVNEQKVSTLDNNKGFVNLRFLQKMNCQKTEWDQARFSSLVEQFAGVMKDTKDVKKKKTTLRKKVQKVRSSSTCKPARH